MTDVRRHHHQLVHGGGRRDDQVGKVDGSARDLQPGPLHPEPLAGARVERHDRGAEDHSIDEGREAFATNRVGVTLRPETELGDDQRSDGVLAPMKLEATLEAGRGTRSSKGAHRRCVEEVPHEMSTSRPGPR